MSGPLSVPAARAESLTQTDEKPTRLMSPMMFSPLEQFEDASARAEAFDGAAAGNAAHTVMLRYITAKKLAVLTTSFASNEDIHTIAAAIERETERQRAMERSGK